MLIDNVDSESSMSLDSWEWTCSDEDKEDDDEEDEHDRHHVHHHHSHRPHDPQHHAKSTPKVSSEAEENKGRSESAHSFDSELDAAIHTPKRQEEDKSDQVNLVLQWWC